MRPLAHPTHLNAVSVEVLLAAGSSKNVDGRSSGNEAHHTDGALRSSCAEEARSVGALCYLLHRSVLQAKRTKTMIEGH